MYGYIYKTTNKANGKIYIGQKKSPKFLGTSYLGSGKVLKQAVRKYGKDNFIVELIAECDSKEELDKQEKYYISLHKTTDVSIGYNLASGGSGVPLKGKLHHMYGKHHSEETKRKISQNHKGSKAWAKGKTNVYNEEARKRMGEKNIGKHWYNNGEVQVCVFECPDGFVKGRLPFTEETRKKISESNSGKTSWNAGKTNIYSEEIRKSMGQKNIGRKMSEEHKAKLRKLNRGNTYSKGIKPTEEQKNKIHPSLSTKVSQYSMDGKYIATYNGIREAAKATGSHYGRIGSCCRGEIKYSNNYQWRYTDSTDDIDAVKTIRRKQEV